MVVSYWNSTSNHNNWNFWNFHPLVVSYWNSTSNHNYGSPYDYLIAVVSYWNSTSNHNCIAIKQQGFQLYLIEILHQTTTIEVSRILSVMLYLIEILHQTTTVWTLTWTITVLYLIEILHQTTTFSHGEIIVWCCILLKFYIKPQPPPHWGMSSRVVSYWNSTSNHNIIPHRVIFRIVVSYWNSTSNHNCFPRSAALPTLYLIEILHQTTTEPAAMFQCLMLYLIEILHQTTTRSNQ